MDRIFMLSLLGWLPLISAAPASSTPPLSSAPAIPHATSLTHTPYSGTPSSTGAVSASSIGSGIIPSASVNPSATTYPSDGRLHEAEPGPYIPAGGVGTDGTVPVYNAKSDFDFESLVGYPFRQSAFKESQLANRFCSLSHCTGNGLSLTCSITASSASRTKTLLLLGLQLKTVI